MLDETDLKILEILQVNSRTSNAEIARSIGIAPSAIFERIKKLEDRGAIEQYSLKLNKKKMGFGLTAFVSVRSDESCYSDDLGAALISFPEVLEVHNIAGEDCYLVKMVARDTEHLVKTMKKRFGNLDQKITTKTTIVLETLKERAALPFTSELSEED